MTLEFYSDENILRITFNIHVYEVNMITEKIERTETIEYNYKNINLLKKCNKKTFLLKLLKHEK